MKSTREAYGEALAKLGETYDFFVCDADLSKATQTVHFSKKFPDRFFNLGIAESNLIGFSAGLSTMGKPVFASSFASFAAGRAYDQVRNTLAYSKCNVKIGATHAGVLIGPDGGSHQCIEDIALMRAIPGMVVLCPCDSISTEAYVKAAIQYQGPVYLRFGRMGTPEVYDASAKFVIGQGNIAKQGADVTIIAIGDMVSKSLAVAKDLEGENISVQVVDMASIKPIDKELVLKVAKETGCVVTAEDHNVFGGLGGAVSEILVQNTLVPQEMVGVADVFGSSGDPAVLAEKYHINEKAIADAVKKALSRKG